MPPASPAPKSAAASKAAADLLVEGWAKTFAGTLATSGAARRHREVTDAVHAEGGKIALQILHTGRYGYHPFAVAPSRLKSPISPFTPFALSARGVERQIRAFVNCAAKAREAGYDGVEIMGSEGYFINQFLSLATNRRTDEWGGDWSHRMRLPLEIVARTREAVGHDFIIIYRLSMLDLVAVRADGSVSYGDADMRALAGAVKEAAARVGVPIAWGGDWRALTFSPITGPARAAVKSGCAPTIIMSSRSRLALPNSSRSVIERSRLRPPEGMKVSPLTARSARKYTVASATSVSVGILPRCSSDSTPLRTFAASVCTLRGGRASVCRRRRRPASPSSSR